MPVRTAVGVSESFDAVEAFSEAAAEAKRGLDAECDLCVAFAAAPHLGHAKWILSSIHEELDPAHLIGCGAGGVLGGGREMESGAGAVVWAASLPGATLTTHHLTTERDGEEIAIDGLPPADQLGEALLVLADPHTFASEALLELLADVRPGLPALGGLASAAAAGSASLFRDGDVLDAGAVVCSVSGARIVPCVSQGATPVGPEMTITAADGNVIRELASKPAIERLREAIAGLDEHEQALASEGLMLGVVIDENRPSYERGDFLVRPVIGADPEAGAVAIGEQVRVGQTVRLQVRDGASADADLRESLRLGNRALGDAGPAGALLFTCNGRGSHMFEIPDHDAGAVEDALGAATGGFFCAGEIGPVGGRNFLHGFTATLALFGAD